jgi:anhydro-N-acetylmuramic acid kinase
MSGTSFDGIDVALLEVEDTDSSYPNCELVAFLTRPYREDQRRTIREALDSGGARELALLHTALGEWFSQAAMELLGREGVGPSEVVALGSHGQTVWHDPPDEGHRGTSLQLGCPATIAEGTGIDVVSDFRSRDLAAGGHGAPLVPWADRVFFSSPDGPRAVHNIGGMSNVTWLPRASDSSPVLAFDTGPGVALMDWAAELATGGAQTFDEGGILAGKGEVSEPVLKELLAHPFFRRSPPKSTGREVFGRGMVEEALGLFDGEGTLIPGSAHEGWPQVLATLTALTARTIGDAYRSWVLPKGVDEVYLMGGGSRNPVLFKSIQAELAPVPVRPGESIGMNPDAREAAAFALLAWAHIRGLPANVPEATGSKGPRILGSRTPGNRGTGL